MHPSAGRPYLRPRGPGSRVGGSAARVDPECRPGGSVLAAAGFTRTAGPQALDAGSAGGTGTWGARAGEGLRMLEAGALRSSNEDQLRHSTISAGPGRP